MFNSLTGIITGRYPQKVFINTHGIEWDVTVPDSTLDSIPSVGEEGKIYVWMQHTDVLMTLFGFASESDRTLFFDLLKVDGIGPKAAIKIMSNITASSLASVLDTGDLDALQKVPGVGKKTAAKMLLQLKGKLTLEESSTSSSEKRKDVPFVDVVSGLVSMGYDKKNVENVIENIYASLKDDAKFASLSDSAKEDAIFRQAIVELAQ